MKHITNIIFDLGGVIIDLNPQFTIAEFSKLSYMPFDALYTQAGENKLFTDLDKGIISQKAFFDGLRMELPYDGPDESLLKAWNAMLLDVPEKRLDLLVKMKQKYNTYLLSNTCEPHIKQFEHDLYIKHGVRNFNDYFDEVYYSCRIGMRKPDAEIFEFVLKENGLKPGETVFIDDAEQHVKAAGELGINAYLLPKTVELAVLLKELGL